MEELAASDVLNRQQRIGVRHYHDFQERMQREEVAEIETKVSLRRQTRWCVYCPPSCVAVSVW